MITGICYSDKSKKLILNKSKIYTSLDNLQYLASNEITINNQFITFIYYTYNYKTYDLKSKLCEILNDMYNLYKIEHHLVVKKLRLSSNIHTYLSKHLLSAK